MSYIEKQESNQRTGDESIDTPEGDQFSDPQDDEEVEKYLKALTQKKLRWGVIKMPPHLTNKLSSGTQVQHLGLGDEEDYISAPEDGMLYI